MVTSGQDVKRRRESVALWRAVRIVFHQDEVQPVLETYFIKVAHFSRIQCPFRRSVSTANCVTRQFEKNSFCVTYFAVRITVGPLHALM